MMTSWYQFEKKVMKSIHTVFDLQFLVKHRIVQVPNPLYLLYLALCECILISELKIHLKGISEEVKNRNMTVFANGPGDLGSVPGRVIPKTQKMVLDASLLNTQHYKVRIKGKVKQSREGVAPSPTPWCSSYRKGSLRVTLDYGRQLYFTYIIFKEEF